ncbi:DUF4142 domain-containing protein [Glycocaulis sp.]|uniref:DUF4142 domain-containing protein n=1 Tax=Glycocaulis sp. TaxID=1969725 RepID=UPI003D19A2BC
MKTFHKGIFAAAIIVATPAARMEPSASDPVLVEEEGLRSNQFATEAALWVVFKIEAGQMAAELAEAAEIRAFAEQMVADQRQEALALTRAANASAIEADALERLQTHHPDASAEGPGTVSDRNVLRAREATQDAPGSQSRTGSPEAPGSAAWSATQAGQMIERRLEQLRDVPDGQFDASFVQQMREAHEAELALYEAYAGTPGRQPMRDYAESRLADIRSSAERASALDAN